MGIFYVGKDFETSKNAGAGNMFQVHTLIDGNKKNVTSRIDVGRHFDNDDELKEDLSTIFNIPVTDIDLEDIENV